MKFQNIIFALILGAGFFATPVFASATTASAGAAQKQFHGVLDVYLKENAKLENTIQRNAWLDERSKSQLLSLVKGHMSELLSLRAGVFNTSNTKSIGSLAKLAQQKRTAMVHEERDVITPVMQVADFEKNILPTANARLATMKDKLSKSRYDKLDAELRALASDAGKLHEQLLGKQPPTNATTVIKGLQARVKELYRDIKGK
jgi:hypothetical protein